MKPMLAQIGKEPFDSDNHIFDWKWNGIRILGHIDGGSAHLQGRSGADFTIQFPELANLPDSIKAKRCIVDGEVVCLDENGLPDFSRVQQRFGKQDPVAITKAAKEYPATYMAFDVVQVEDHDFTAGAPDQADQMQRKEILESILMPNNSIKLSSWVTTYGTELYAEAVRLNREGIMAKTKKGLYYPGGRTPDWVKLKVPKYGTFTVGGYTVGVGWRRSMMGAVVLGVPDLEHGGKLRWVGCAGTGFTQVVLESLYHTLRSIETEESPFITGTKVPKLSSWVEPIIQVEVKFYDVTKGGQLVWPVFQRITADSGS
ncbi:hypothetical protein KKH23_09950 [Patescibacteria group bacterium]|nr:hypothetical protein [Patescibacteria group bacterium]